MALEPAHAVAHILLDVLSVVDDETPEEDANTEAIQVAVQQFNERDLFGVTFVQAEGEFTVSVNATHVIKGAALLAQVLLAEVEIASAGALTAHDIIARVREHLDRHEQA